MTSFEDIQGDLIQRDGLGAVVLAIKKTEAGWYCIRPRRGFLCRDGDICFLPTSAEAKEQGQSRSVIGLGPGTSTDRRAARSRLLRKMI